MSEVRFKGRIRYLVLPPAAPSSPLPGTKSVALSLTPLLVAALSPLNRFSLAASIAARAASKAAVSSVTPSPVAPNSVTSKNNDADDDDDAGKDSCFAGDGVTSARRRKREACGGTCSAV